MCRREFLIKASSVFQFSLIKQQRMCGLYMYAIKNPTYASLTSNRASRNFSPPQCLAFTPDGSLLPHQLWISWAPHPGGFISFSLGPRADTPLFSTLHGFSVAPIKVFNQTANPASLPGFVCTPSTPRAFGK